MQHKGVLWAIAATTVAVAVACGESSPNLNSPSAARSAATGAGVDAAADGSTIKASAPTLTSPIGGARLTVAEATLTFQSAKGTYAPNQVFTHRVQLLNANNVVLESRMTSANSITMTTVLDTDTLYRWRVRAEQDEVSFGPWSTTESFRSLEKQEGYIRGNEIYDPLTEGKTVGRIYGPTTFIPGVGITMESRSSYVEYELPTTLVEGEYSALISGLEVISSNEDPKDRMITMREGDAAINDNIYRMSVDKRGNGAVAWRFLTGPGEYIETQGAERRVHSFHESLTYFVQATWRNNFFAVLIKEGGFNGEVVYNFGKEYTKSYTPLPHKVFIGSPYKAGDRGDASTVENMVVRQVWVSPNPRPAYANK